MTIYNVQDYRIGGAANRGFTTTLLSSSQFVPIDIDVIPGLTIHFRADTGIFIGANGNFNSGTNSAPGRLYLSATPGARSPFTSSTPFGVPVPYFSGSTGDAKLVADWNTLGVYTLSGVISPQLNQFHCFAVWSVDTKGADVADATGYTARSLAGTTGGWMVPVSFQNSGLKIMAFDAANRVSAFLPYQTGTRYISESSLGALAPLSLSLALNGGTPVTGNMTNVIGGSDNFFIGSGHLAASTTTMQGQLAEFIMFSKSVDSATATQIRLTLGQRWGINTL